MEKIIKNLPIFWTFINKNGMTTIHQVRFRGLYVSARTETKDGFCKVEIEKAIFNIAGRPETFIGGSKKFGAGISDYPNDNSKKYFTLSEVYATREEAEKASKSTYYPRNQFHHINDTRYTTTKWSPLSVLSEFSWQENIPSNMKLKTNNEGVSYLCGYRFDGLETSYYRVEGERNVNVVEGETIDNISELMVFDMVSREWVNKPKYDYYKTKEECDNVSEQKVFVFED